MICQEKLGQKPAFLSTNIAIIYMKYEEIGIKYIAPGKQVLRFSHCDPRVENHIIGIIWNEVNIHGGGLCCVPLLFNYIDT